MRAPAQPGGIQDLIQRTSVLEIVGNMIRVRANEAALGDLAEVQNVDGAILTARAVGLDRDVASLQVFAGGVSLPDTDDFQLANCWLRG
jgi:V/A-type H+/Na+-transporting ATPase subunit B